MRQPKSCLGQVPNLKLQQKLADNNLKAAWAEFKRQIMAKHNGR